MTGSATPLDVGEPALAWRLGRDRNTTEARAKATPRNAETYWLGRRIARPLRQGKPVLRGTTLSATNLTSVRLCLTLEWSGRFWSGLSLEVARKAGMQIFHVSVIGDADEDDFFATTLDKAREVAEREYRDYFGEPIRWKEPAADGGSQYGSFKNGPYNRVTVSIYRREVEA